MFTKSGIIELRDTMHERLDLLLTHVATVPDHLHHKLISGFGHTSIWKQLVHILTCEEGCIHDLQNKAFAGWHEEDCPTMADLLVSCQRTNTRGDTNLRRRSDGRATQHDPVQASRGLGRRTPESRFYPVARHNPRISPQGPGCRDAANSRISSS